MTALQQVNLGAATDGTQGDTVRTGFTKLNSNTAALAAQIAVASATLISAAQSLTVADHVGKRVNLDFAATDTVGFPPSADAGADAVIQLRNVGTVAVTLAPAGSDTLALTTLAPGDSVLFDTDGAGAWNVLVRSRPASESESVGADLSVGGNLSVSAATKLTGKLTAADVEIVGTLTSDGAATVGANLTVEGDAIVSRNAPVLILDDIAATTGSAVEYRNNGVRLWETKSYGTNLSWNVGRYVDGTYVGNTLSLVNDTGTTNIAGRVTVNSTADDGGTALQINGSVRAGNYVFNSQNTTDSGLIGFGNANGPTVGFYGSATTGAGSLVFRTDAIERVRISADGRLLVGVSDNEDNALLQVGGQIVQRADYSEIRMRAANESNLNGWRLASTINGTNDGYITLQHSYDDFGSNFLNAWGANSAGVVTINKDITTADATHSLQIGGDTRSYGTIYAGADGTVTSWLSADSGSGYFQSEGDTIVGSAAADGDLVFTAGNRVAARVYSTGRTSFGSQTDDGLSTVFVGGSVRSTGKILGRNALNVLVNGSGELGNLTWNNGNWSGVTGGAGEGSLFYNPAAITADGTYDEHDVVVILPNTVLTISGEIYTTGMTAGSGRIGIDFLDSNQNVISNVFYTLDAGNDWTFGFATATAPADTAYWRCFMGAVNSPNAPANTLRFRHIKVEENTSASMYSQEATLSYVANAVKVADNEFIQAYISAAVQIPTSTITNVTGFTTTVDRRGSGAWNASAGSFTPKRTGPYSIDFLCTLSGVITTGYAQISIMNGASQVWTYITDPQTRMLHLAGVFNLTAGVSYTFAAWQDTGDQFATNAGSTLTKLTIYELP
ncbi:hypothetical protein G3N59_05430 [Paraburkholderia sp. Ac-20340]|uniref:hypothetical protein n=1 Tax=Paraburkholderia sp. Ac-20340 TaxID=2703888 RepID=UPI00197FA071|nr:hypothetical protein [Paraburkholderia sp. Ac-20340]MBN3852817.1 hypothetical protein [Paraburkholderia sp. Ac-20340]